MEGWRLTDGFWNCCVRIYLLGLQEANEEWDVVEVDISVLVAICFGLGITGLQDTLELQRHTRLYLNNT